MNDFKVLFCLFGFIVDVYFYHFFQKSYFWSYWCCFVIVLPKYHFYHNKYTITEDVLKFQTLVACQNA